MGTKHNKGTRIKPHIVVVYALASGSLKIKGPGNSGKRQLDVIVQEKKLKVLSWYKNAATINKAELRL